MSERKNRPAQAPAFLVVTWQLCKSRRGNSMHRLAAAAYRLLVVRRAVLRLAAFFVERLAVFLATFRVVAICVGSSESAPAVVLCECLPAGRSEGRKSQVHFRSCIAVIALLIEHCKLMRTRLIARIGATFVQTRQDEFASRRGWRSAVSRSRDDAALRARRLREGDCRARARPKARCGRRISHSRTRRLRTCDKPRSPE